MIMEVQLLSLHNTTPKSHTTSLRVLSKCLLNFDRYGAMTTSLGGLFQCPQTVAQENDWCLSHYPTICLRVALLGHPGRLRLLNCYSSYHSVSGRCHGAIQDTREGDGIQCFTSNISSPKLRCLECLETHGMHSQEQNQRWIQSDIWT